MAIPPIISATNAIQMSSDEDVAVADARGGPDALQRYKEAHFEGAMFFDLESMLSEKGDPAQGGRHPLPAAKKFGDILGKAGISPDTHVLVYDDKMGANAAARLWWMLRALGHRKVQVIDGGLKALTDAGARIASGAGHQRSAVPYPADDWKLPVAHIDTVAEAANDPESLVIDVREAYRYRGESEPIDLVAGHIPGAINLPYVDNLGSEGRFKSSKELRDYFQSSIGDVRPEKIIVHCGSGVTACHTLLAMESAGITGASLYVGSWSEWSRNERPIAVGD